MGCSACKEKTQLPQGETPKSTLMGRLFYFIVTVIIFSFILPVLWGVGIVVLFKSFVLNKTTEILPSLTYVIELLQKTKKYKTEKDDFDEDDDINPDEYELMGLIKDDK